LAVGKSTMDFAKTFESLTGNAPFPWQEKLYNRFVENPPESIPSSCDIPTGLGKTNVIAVWLLALAADMARLPRRLVYVVNRRTVVDQTTDEVVKIRKRLKDQAEVGELRKRLGWTNDAELPALSTLRGQFADNRQWSADPSRPASGGTGERSRPVGLGAFGWRSEGAKGGTREERPTGTAVADRVTDSNAATRAAAENINALVAGVSGAPNGLGYSVAAGSKQ
jgi:hypothetical protein